MIRIILVRHGEVIKPNEKSYIGCTDLKLSDKGCREAQVLSQTLSASLNAETITELYASPLNRCQKTAQYLSKEFSIPIQTQSELEEIHLGDWEDVPVQHIRNNYPEEYKKRGEHIGTYRTPGGETFEEVGKRAEHFLRSICSDLPDVGQTIFVVTHAGWIRSLICRLKGLAPDHVLDFSIPHVSQTCVLYEDGKFIVEQIGHRNTGQLTEEEIRCLYSKYSVPERVIQHMKKVSEVCMEIVSNFPAKTQKELNVDMVRLHKAALLHDLMRTSPNHARRSAEVLRLEGYYEIAGIVEKHHSADFDPDALLNEEEILFYADKLVQDDQMVSIEERFAKSRKKCLTPEAITSHTKQYEKAIGIQEKIRCTVGFGRIIE